MNMSDGSRIIEAARKLVKASADIRGTQSMSASPMLMQLIDAVDDDDHIKIILRSVGLMLEVMQEFEVDERPGTVHELINACHLDEAEFKDLLTAILMDATGGMI